MKLFRELVFGAITAVIIILAWKGICTFILYCRIF